jgi:hypothetical protein
VTPFLLSDSVTFYNVGKMDPMKKFLKNPSKESMMLTAVTMKKDL